MIGATSNLSVNRTRCKQRAGYLKRWASGPSVAEMPHE